MGSIGPSVRRDAERIRLALHYARTPGFDRRLCRAPAFGVRQLAGAFARGTVEFEAAWLALVDKSGDKSPQSKRCRAGKTACRMTVPRVRNALNMYSASRRMEDAAEFVRHMVRWQ